MNRPAFVSGAVAVSSVLAGLVCLTSWNPPAGRVISSVALSRTGRWLAGGTPHGRITLWDRANREPPLQIDFQHGRLNDLQFSPDETVLAIAARDLGLYHLDRPAVPRPLRSDERNYGVVRFSRDAGSGAAVLATCCSSIGGDVAFTPDGRAIANAGHWPGIRDARSGQLLGRLTGTREFYTFRPIAFDPVQGTVLMGSQDGRVYVWDLATRRRIAVSPPQPGYVDGLTVSAGGWAVSASFGKVLRMWNPRIGRQRTLSGALPTSNLETGPDGTSVIFGTADGSVESWDIRTGQRTARMTMPRD